ncbi:MAG: DedA family protein [Desulfomonile tiedjei]|uniref:DedA family protein n=1 Tax=Desulfomonile tiedjei TaxID=2358 RepID=A0A9D6V472_9BACT|nr:DedA family protein [Desulfomonile tiedjei]
MVQQLAVYFTYIIEQLGYWGAGFLMALESMVAPVPSELVMPFVGFLAAEGKFSIEMSIFATSVGSIVGSLLSYYMGYLGGRPIVLKVGRYLLLNREHLEWTEKWFEKHGSWTILASRFIPVVRHLISIPAGLGKMRIVPFCVYTLIGATAWNTFLLVCGYKLRQNWTLVQQYSHELDMVVAICLAIAAVWFVVLHIRRSKVAVAANPD